MADIIKDRQQEIIEELSFFEDWEDKYLYIISLGKSLKDFPEDKKIPENLIEGCQSQVWFDYSFNDGKLVFMASSDAMIVSGLISMVLRIYNDTTPQEILNSNINFLEDTGFDKNLSLNRNNGLKAMLNYIYEIAREKV